MTVVGQTLAISGGGVRGVIPAMICQEIEKRKSAPIYQLFDMVAGTSTGTIVATGLLSGKFTASQLVDEYKDFAKNIFHESWRQEIASADGYYSSKYDPTGMEAAVKKLAGDIQLQDFKTDALFTTVKVYDANRSPEICHIRTGSIWDPVTADVITRCSTAAPCFFPAKEVTLGGETFHCIDGGLMENNPTHSGVLACAKKMGCGSNQIVVSLGTGNELVKINHATLLNGGEMGWVHPLIDVLFEGQDVMADNYTQNYIGSDGTYLRAQMDVTGHHAMDDASDANMAALIEIADGWIADNEKELINVCDQLQVREKDFCAPPAKRLKQDSDASGSNPSSGWRSLIPSLW